MTTLESATQAVAALLAGAHGEGRKARLRAALRLLFCEMAAERGLSAPWHRALREQASGELGPGARAALRGAARAPAEALGQLYEEAICQDARRASGSHFTAPALAARVVASALAPLGLEKASPQRIGSLRVCDPAMGAGAFLLAACRALAARLAAARRRAGARGEGLEREALTLVARRCLSGLDLDPAAVELAHLSLWLVAGDADLPFDFAAGRLCWADALSPRPPLAGPFDVFVGNPPWVSYAGRAAQPLAPQKRADYARRFASFAGYRNLQGLFVERCAGQLAPGGRLGLVLPSSMAELAGYAPARAAHDRLCRCDDPLPDLGEKSFDGVFQPGMVLLSTRLPAERPAEGAPWPLERPDLGPRDRELLARLSGPPLPPHLFGERGLQTGKGDREHLRERPDPRHPFPLRVGSDIEPFHLKAPSVHAAPAHFGARLGRGWGSVRVLIRQTARVPIAALSDGVGFRNSLLAGFGDELYPAEFLAAYLNSTPIRWFHYTSHRDARLGMPQVKIGHLRALPAPRDRSAIAPLAALGARLSKNNRGVTAADQAELDRLAARALGLSAADLAHMSRRARW